jgi:hypothetical protein
VAIAITNPAEAKAFLYCLLDEGWRVKEFESDEYGYQAMVTLGGGQFVMALSPNAERAQAFCDATWQKALAEAQRAHFKKLVVSPQPHAFWDRYLAQGGAGQQPFFGLKGPVQVGDYQLTFAAPAPSGRVTEAVRETVDILGHPKLEDVFEGELAAQRPGKLGPWAVAVGMLLSALVVLSASEPVFSFKMSTPIPNAVSALFLVLAGALALSRKIVLVCWFLICRAVVNAVTICTAYEDHSFRLAAGITVTIVIAAIHLAALILVPIRAKDFGYARRREFFRAFFF